VQGLLSPQFGGGEWPHVPPAQVSLPLQAFPSSPHAPPAQQGCPAPPHDWQLPAEQTFPLAHCDDAQQGWPTAPHALHVPPRQTLPLQLPPQQACPSVPQLPHEPRLLQADPSWHAGLGDGQQGCPVPPQAHWPAAHTPWPPSHIPALVL
jgi:hypothetical protein